MTVIKKTNITIQEGDKKTVKETEYYEVKISEMNDMITKVFKGGDETKLREEMIKNSTWRG